MVAPAKKKERKMGTFEKIVDQIRGVFFRGRLVWWAPAKPAPPTQKLSATPLPLSLLHPVLRYVKMQYEKMRYEDLSGHAAFRRAGLILTYLLTAADTI